MNVRHPIFLLSRGIVRASALLVPWWWRRGFVQEWEAELYCAWARNEERGVGAAGRFRLLRRSLYSVGDALTISTRGWRMEGIGRDLRIAFRTLLRKPAFSLVAVLTLALGIGANTAVYSLVDGVLLEPLPYPDSDELVNVYMTAPGVQLPVLPLTALDYTVFRAGARVFDEFSIYGGAAINLTGGDRPERLRGYQGTFSFFDVVGVLPALGRTFVEGDDAPGAAAVAVLSDGLWRRSFGADRSILGRTISLNGVATEVVGVMPAGFDMPRENAELWIPLTVDAASPDSHDHSFSGLARLSDGVSVQEAFADMERLMLSLMEANPDDYAPEFMEQAGVAPVVQTRKDQLVGNIQQALWVLLGVVGFVLLIACANVANLFLVRAEGRTREVAVRTSLGASPGDVVRYYLTEALVLASVGGLLGAFLGQLAVSGFARTAPVALPRLGDVGVDGSVLAFTAAVSLAAAVLFGLFPAMRYAAPSLVENLKEGSRGATGGRGGKRARSALVVIQVALALILLVGSGLMARSFWALRAVDPGFVAEGVLTMRLSLPRATYPTDQDAVAFHNELLRRLSGVPGVVSAAVVNNVPLGGSRSGSDMGVEDFPPDGNTLPRIVEHVAASQGYLETMGIQLKEGRWLNEVDGADRTGNVVLGENFANRYWPDGGAIGKRINASSEMDGAWLTVVGVVKRVRQNSLTEESEDLMYTPLLNPEGAFDPPRNVSVVVKTDLEPTSLTRSVQEAIWSLDANLPVANPRAMTQVLGNAMSATSFTMVLLAASSAIALLLGAIGIYGVISYMVSQRTREIGVRMALGAPRANVLRMVAQEGLVLAGLGLVVGLMGAYGMSTVMQSLLVGVDARDTVTYGSVTVILGLTAALASILPARRAVRIDPVEALRNE